MMGRPGNHGPALLLAGGPGQAIGRLVWLVRRERPDVITTYNDFGGYGHPDHIRAHQVAVGAFERAGDPTWYPPSWPPSTVARGPRIDEAGLAPWAPAKLYSRPSGVDAERDARADRSARRDLVLEPAARCHGAEQLAEFEASAARILSPTSR